MTVYDTIGVGYAQFRRSDPRIAGRIHAALGDAATVVNVGAGPGSYEPLDRWVVAVEPSLTMIQQRSLGAPSAVRAIAEDLPFADEAFDAAMALLTVHHWPDARCGLAELRRVTKGPVVVFTFDHAVHDHQWLVAEYLPAMAELDADVPSPTDIAAALGGAIVEVVPIPRDCVDGFCHAWWQRPAAYLDPKVRASISGIARLPEAIVSEAMDRLKQDLETGAWQERHADLSRLDEHDGGLRLVVSEPDKGQFFAVSRCARDYDRRDGNHC